MSNFSDFLNSKESKVVNKNDQQKSTAQDKANNQKMSNDDLKDMIDKYSSLSSDSLLREFMEMTMKRKQNGELKNGELEQIASTILPYLNNEQKDSLQKIIELVKNV